MLNLNDFQPITLEDYPIFKRHYSRFLPPHSDYVFTTMISWHDYIQYSYMLQDDQLIILTHFKDRTYLRPPHGNITHDILSQVFMLARTLDNPTPLGMIPETTKKTIEQQYPTIKFTSHRDYYDYVYCTDELVNLKGSAYSSIRNRLNKFTKSTEYQVEKITEENFHEVKEFLKRWCLWKDCESDELLDHERKAILYTIAHFYELNLEGLLIIINGQIEAIAVYEHMTPDTILVHFEKGSPDYDGVYKVINWETAKTVQTTSKYINRESDMGIDGLKQAKLSYRPHHFNKVYHINKNDIDDQLK